MQRPLAELVAKCTFSVLGRIRGVEMTSEKPTDEFQETREPRV